MNKEQFIGLEDPIDSIFENISSGDKNHSLELFKDDKKGDIALKTDLKDKELVLVVALMTENELIKKDLGDFDLFGDFLNQFRRHKVSLDRKSRIEFVESNRKPLSSDLLNEASSVKNLTESRQ